MGLISGGGSGHEPMHGGFVGMGMLDAACPVDEIEADCELPADSGLTRNIINNTAARMNDSPVTPLDIDGDGQGDLAPEDPTLRGHRP